ncbi:ABC transporter substrate-binding protein [Rhodococcus sp. 14-2483-1-2]|uniref:ABC transporter substrate-binding protein n=1 Tax=Rhodococcus sp. 14-2483-1-2 TaxID=2023147 RepID=UPI00148359F5|nr:ABC transporter substrate-binding protein [Rhodococcus sp. 14-2483-1-2]
MTVDSDLGEVTLTKKPEKIVVVGDARYVDVLAALGEAPAVFGSGEDEQTTLKSYPWLEGQYGAYDDKIFPAYEIDAEAIGALQPDLIILQTFGNLDEGLQKQLSAIAPVYADDNPENWENAVTTMGAVTNKREQAEKLVSDMKAEFSAARERIAGLQGKTFFAGSMLDGSLYPLPEMGIFASELGLIPADNMPVIPDRGDPISAENRDQITADVVFVASFASGAHKDLESDPRYADLPSVKSGTMVILEPLIGLDNMTAVAPTTVPWLLERILPGLEKSALNTVQ